jgi:hypothetical protein
MNPQPSTVIAARVPPATAQELRRIADVHCTTVSRLVSRLLTGAVTGSADTAAQRDDRAHLIHEVTQ